MKKVMLLVFAIMLFATGVVSAAANWGKFEGYNIVKLVINGKTAAVEDTPPVILKGRTMVPLSMLEDTGLKATWDSNTYTVNVKTPEQPKPLDPAQYANDIIKLGGYGVTLTPVNKQLTAIVYFEEQSNFEGDWEDIFRIFMLLADLNAEYSQVIYVDGETKIGTVDIPTKHLKDFKSGQINDDKLKTLWNVYGFQNQPSNGSTTNTNNNSNVPSETNKPTEQVSEPTPTVSPCKKLADEHTMEWFYFDQRNNPFSGSYAANKAALEQEQANERAQNGC